MTTVTAVTAVTAIRELQSAVAAAHWRMDYREFCRRIQKTPDLWTEEKWAEWQQLAESFRAFDAETLARLVEPASTTEAAAR